MEINNLDYNYLNQKVGDLEPEILDLIRIMKHYRFGEIKVSFRDGVPKRAEQIIPSVILGAGELDKTQQMIQSL